MNPAVAVANKMMEWTGGHPHTISGRGSTPSYTRGLRVFLPLLWRQLGVRTVFDAGCGDGVWMQRMDLTGIKVTAADLPEFDILHDPMPAVDLVLCRDVMIHLPIDHLHTIRWPTPCWVMATTYPGGNNTRHPRHTQLDLCSLGWPAPKVMVPEQDHGKYLGLWWMDQ